MTKSETIQALWQAVILQKAPDMAQCFTQDAVILCQMAVPGCFFTRDCADKRGVPYCTLCGAFPCGERLRRKKATVLDHDWLLWKRKTITGK